MDISSSNGQTVEILKRWETFIETTGVAGLFRNFLESTFSLENLQFVEEVCEYEKISKTNTSLLLSRALQIYETYLGPQAEVQVNVSSKFLKPFLEQIQKIKAQEIEVSNDLFLPLKLEIVKLMLNDCVPQFKAKYTEILKRIQNRLQLPYLFWRCIEELDKREKLSVTAFTENDVKPFYVEALASSLKNKDRMKADSISIEHLNDHSLVALLKYYFQNRKYPVVAPEITVFLDIIISRGQEVVDRIRQILHTLPSKDQAVLHLTLRLLKRVCGNDLDATNDLSILFANLFFKMRRKENEDARTTQFLIAEEEQIFEIALLLCSEKPNDGQFISKEMYFEKKQEWSKIYQAELQRFNFMKSSDLSLQPRDWVLLSNGAQALEFPVDNCVIVSEGARNGYLFRVIKGECHVLKHRAGKQETIGVLTSGTFFGEMSIIVSSGEATSTIVAMKDSVVQRMSPVVLFPLFDAYPDLARRFYWTVANKISNRLLQLDSLEPSRRDDPQKVEALPQLKSFLASEFKVEDNSKSLEQKDKEFSKRFKLTEDEIIIKDFACGACNVIISQNYLCVTYSGFLKKRKVIPLNAITKVDIEPKSNGIEISFLPPKQLETKETSKPVERDKNSVQAQRASATSRRDIKSLTLSSTSGSGGSKPTTPRKEGKKVSKTLLIEQFPLSELKQAVLLLSTLAEQRKKEVDTSNFEIVVLDEKDRSSSISKRRLMLKPRDSVLEVVSAVQQKKSSLTKEVHMLSARDWQMILDSKNNEIVMFDQGNLIFKQGREYDYVYHILHGSVVAKLAGKVLSTQEQGHVVGAISFLQKGAASVNVYAHEDGVKLLKINKMFLTMLFQSYPEVGHKFFYFLCINLGEIIIQRETARAKRRTKVKSEASLRKSVRSESTESGQKAQPAKSRSTPTSPIRKFHQNHETTPRRGSHDKRASQDKRASHDKHGDKRSSLEKRSSHEKRASQDQRASQDNTTRSPRVRKKPSVDESLTDSFVPDVTTPGRSNSGKGFTISVDNIARKTGMGSPRSTSGTPRSPLAGETLDWRKLQKKFCIHCGFDGLPSIAKFCAKCGGPQPD